MKERDRPVETRSAQVNASVTPSEKHDVRLIAALEGKTESDIIYPYLAPIFERAAKIRQSQDATSAA